MNDQHPFGPEQQERKDGKLPPPKPQDPSYDRPEQRELGRAIGGEAPKVAEFGYMQAQEEQKTRERFSVYRGAGLDQLRDIEQINGAENSLVSIELRTLERHAAALEQHVKRMMMTRDELFGISQCDELDVGIEMRLLSPLHRNHEREAPLLIAIGTEDLLEAVTRSIMRASYEAANLRARVRAVEESLRSTSHPEGAA